MLKGLLSGQTGCASWQRGLWLRPSHGGCCGLGRENATCRVVTAAAKHITVLQVPDPGSDDGLSSRLAPPCMKGAQKHDEQPERRQESVSLERQRPQRGPASEQRPTAVW